MAQTPEGKVKAAVKRVLAKYQGIIWGWWPVPSGYGQGALDFIGCARGRMVAIETKAPGKKPTALQEICIRDMRAAGAVVFVIASTDGPDMQALVDWMEENA